MKKVVFLCVLLLIQSCGLEDIDAPGVLVPMTVDQDSLLPSLEINGTLLHVETFGDINNPILIFLHGGPGGDFRALISEKGVENVSRFPTDRAMINSGLTRLQDDYFLVFYDQRSAGLSKRHNNVSFDDYINDLDAIISHYLSEKLDFAGVSESQVSIFAWSFGGILATGYINQYPDKINNVVMYEPGPFDKQNWDYIKENTTSIFAQVGRDWLEEYLLSKDHFTPDTHERADYQLMINVFRAQPEFHENPNTPMWRFGAMLSDDNLDFSLSESYDITSNINPAFGGKALFIAGSLTVEELPQYMDWQMAYYPDVEYAEIENAGHTGPWEKAEEISILTRSFLNR